MFGAGSEQHAGVNRADVQVLEAALWKQLGEAQDLGALAGPWLALQCSQIASARRGAVLLDADGTGRLAALAAWPEGSDAPLQLSACAEHAASQGRGVVQKPAPDGNPGAGSQIAYPVVVDGRSLGAVAVEVDDDRAAALRIAARQLQWGVAWIRDRLHRHRADERSKAVGRMSAALELLAAGVEEERFAATCRLWVTELALTADCERVSVGFVSKGRVRVASISHSAQFGKKMNLVGLLEAAMDEAVDQQATILYPPGSDAGPDAADQAAPVHVTAAHAALAEAHGDGAILTIPLFVRDAFVGAFTFQRGRGGPFTQDTVDFLDCVVAVLGPVLHVKRREDRWLAVKAAEAAQTLARQSVGPGHTGLKLGLAAALAAAAFAAFATGTYQVTANAVVEGAVQQAIVAPFNGFIDEAPMRAGDEVLAGQVVATLDQRDLALERLKWVTERNKKSLEYDRAIGERNRAGAKIAGAEREEADAQIRMIDAQLARSTMRAPFDGLVVSGDLSQSIGATVQRGELLFEIAPLDAYRVAIDVDESQIGDIAIGFTGSLVVASLPETAFPVLVEKITPVAKVEEGRNTFRVEAALQEDSPRLRPGMKGVAKIAAGEQRLVWIWSRSLLSWLRLTTWRWFG